MEKNKQLNEVPKVTGQMNVALASSTVPLHPLVNSKLLDQILVMITKVFT